MTVLIKHIVTRGMIGGMIVLQLFGCATVKEMDISQKYEDSKSWFKEKWHTMETQFSSNADEPSALEPYAENSKYVVYRTQWSYETLPGLAEWFTGHYGNWKALARANPGLNPDHIVLGNRIHIPADLLKTQKRLPRKVVARTVPGYFAHTVTKTDEKLSDIAKWYTGSANNQKAIAAANPDIDPEFLLVGNEIYIPSNLLITEKRHHQKPVQKTAKVTEERSQPEAAPSAPKPRKIQLFGPKQFQAN